MLEQTIEDKDDQIANLKIEMERIQKGIKLLNICTDSLDNLLSAGKLAVDHFGFEYEISTDSRGMEITGLRLSLFNQQLL